MSTAYPQHKIITLTALSLLAFAANSVLCRLALQGQAIDPASFTLIRVLSGAFVLALLALGQLKGGFALRGSWRGSVYLVVYAAAFSFAYISLDTATGALILFAAVQLSMLLVSFIKGQRFNRFEYLGVAIAFSGLVYLLWPNVSTPSAYGFGLMLLSGVAWGFYSLNGQGAQQPLLDTAGNFIRALPFVVLLFVFVSETHLSAYGVLLAVVSGGLASGVGYALWYAVLPQLAGTKAAVIQLLVPVIAAVGGLVFVGEPLGFRLIVATLLTLGGILLVVLNSGRQKHA